MKDKILIIITCIAIIFTITGCKPKNRNEDKTANNDIIIEAPLNEQFDIDNSIDDLKKENAVLLEKNEILQKYNLGDNSKLEMQVSIESTETNYEEIALIKITNENQIYEIQKTMFDRVEVLKEENKTNSSVMEILENNENIRIKVQDGIGILIISTEADKIMETFDEKFIK